MGDTHAVAHWLRECDRDALESRYRWIYKRLVPVARDHGYALGLHGSVRTDLDIIALPWTDEAVDAFTLVKAITEACGGARLHGGRWDAAAERFVHVDANAPTLKPHGRLVWTIHLGGGPYIDFGVMPRRTRRAAGGVEDKTGRADLRPAG